MISKLLASFPQKQGSDFMSGYIWEFWDFVDDFGLMDLPLLGGLELGLVVVIRLHQCPEVGAF